MDAPTHLHLTDEEVAALASLEPEGIDAAKYEHAKACKICRRAVDEVALYESMWVASGNEVKWTAPVDGLPASIRPERSFRDRLRPGWGWRPALAAISIAVVAVSAVGLRQLGDRRASLQLIEPVRSAVLAAELPGPIAIPGFVADQAPPSELHRSGFVPLDGNLNAAVRQLATAYHDGSDDAHVAVTLIGAYLATGQFGHAGSIAESARERFPGDTNIAIGQALAEFGQGRLAASLDMLREILSSQPSNDLVLVNLAVVLSANGQSNEALEAARQVVDRSQDPALVGRAQSMLDASVDR